MMIILHKKKDLTLQELLYRIKTREKLRKENLCD